MNALEIFKKFKNSVPSEIELAKSQGFTKEELKLMKIFWQPCFNKSRILLDREIIKKYLCKNDSSRYAVNNFYNRILIPNFKEGYDYNIVTRDEIKAEQGYSNLNTLGNQPRTKYCIVTGRCIKKFGMMQNEFIQDYYIK